MRVAMIGLKGIPATTGGIERHVEQLAPLLVGPQVQVAAYCRRWYTSDDGPLHGVERIFQPTIKTKHLDAISHSLFSTLSALKRDFDLIHFHALGPASLALLPHLAGRPVVVTVHGLDYERAKWGAVARWSLRQAERVLTHCATRVIVVSHTLAQYFEQRWGIDARAIPNGVPLPRRLDPRLISDRWGLERGRYVLSLGRLVAEKRVQDLIAAFKTIDCGGRLVIAGDANFAESYAADLRRAAADDPRVLFTGAVTGDELCELLSNAAAFVQASELEGLPIALLEALSYGLPVVASEIAVHGEVLNGAGGPYGLLYPTGDVGALAQRLGGLLADPDSGRSMGERAVAHVAEHYTWQRAARSTLEVYRQALGHSA
ncbi:MAG: glycosyltransferase family 4 protein [Candidatus Alcyoniella australis]|nr:glycosyltransferase family 4 protein [Candidatus Alcyoniella australis]